MKEFGEFNRENPRSETKKLSGRETSRGESCFPVHPELAKDIFNKVVTKDSLKAGEDMSLAPIFSDIYDSSPALLVDLYGFIDQLDAIAGDEVGGSYAKGAAASYQIIKEQATMNGAKLPSVSQEDIDSFMADKIESLGDEPTEFDVYVAFYRQINKIREKDPGFMAPFEEYAKDPELDVKDYTFLEGAVDIYDKFRRAEQARRMNDALGFKEK